MGFPEAKLFSTRDRATLTFYAGLEVASIHYDRLRDEIFYKGHNVKNMTLTPQQSFYLKNFGACLESEGMDPELCRSYHECLAKVLSYHDTLR